jgi:pimeloyl-ACP methyl ester carboxylesterase
MNAAGTGTERIEVAGIELEVLRRGAGSPILLLHGFESPDPEERFLSLLARRRRIIAPSHPGFGRSPRPEGFETVYDLVRLYLALIDSLPDDKVTLMGFSFGGWLAAEIAVASGQRLDRLVLVDALGLKLGDRETADILDVFNTHPREVRRRFWHDAERFAPDYDTMSDEALVIHARNREALCLYGWHPYLYNPQLKRWLGRISVPSLVLWGASDGIVLPEYGRAYAALIPGARFALIEEAGHAPEIERPEEFTDHVLGFLES